MARRPGQLGNCLFLYANLILFARETGARVIAPAFAPYAASFLGTHRDPFCSYPAAPWRLPFPAALRTALAAPVALLSRALNRMRLSLGTVAGRRIEFPAEESLNARPFLDVVEAHRFLLLDGWLYRWHGDVSDHLDAIKQHFKPVGRIQSEVEAIVKTARGGARRLVGVHVRQGDYKHFEEGKYFYGSDSYAALVRHLSKELDRDARFLVLSNEVQDPKVFAGLPVHIQRGDPVVDLHALAACDLIVGPPSTFSMWASFYGGKPQHLWREPEVMPSLGEFRPVRWT